MRHTLCLALVACLVLAMWAAPAAAKESIKGVSDSAPDTMKSLYKEYKEKGGDAKAAATLFVRGLYYASIAPDKDTAAQYIAIFLEPNELEADPSAYTGCKIWTQTTLNMIVYLREAPRVMRSYFKGTTVDDDYKLPGAAETLEANIQGDLRGKDDERTKKIVNPMEVVMMNVQSTGKSQPTWLRLRLKSDGLYHCDEVQGFSSFCTGVQKPEED